MTRMPRWLILQAEIDYWLFVLGEMRKAAKKRSPIEIAIDQCAGYEAVCIKEAEKIMARIERLKAQHAKALAERTK